MRFATLLITATLITGCASTYKQNVVTVPISKLQQGKPVLIATPNNGSYNGKEYANSGNTTAQAVRSAFARHTNNTVVSDQCKDLNCLKNSKASSASYLVVPEILHWEDRNTEWSGKKDRLEIKITIYDSGDGKELSTTIITGSSKWMTFGGDHPQDLLPEPIGQYIDSLY